jgi:magnesium chelatase family protein
MISKLYTACLQGLDCKIIEVEVDYQKGNFYFSIVGMTDKSIQEAKDRIPSAIRSSNCAYVPMKIIMSLAPADLFKSGPSYDLALAMGYLIASEQVNLNPDKKIFIGELALDGKLRAVNGILPIVDGVKKLGFTDIFIPAENLNEASYIQGINIYPVTTLRELIDHFNHECRILPIRDSTSKPFQKVDKIPKFDLSQVRGQSHAKRALEIAAAGGHNILMCGSPGSGKTMLSRCLSSIMPDLTIEESLEVTRVYSIAGLTSNAIPIINERPFRSPHHTSSEVALVGGGANPRPGEISLAHRGVLFLDEFPEFSKIALESLRQPLEDKVVTISRATASLTFPASFILAVAMNPCKCGYKGDLEKNCICTASEVLRYQKKISGPILDRIDLLVSVPKVKNSQLMISETSESSASVKQRVQESRKIQQTRLSSTGIFCNAEMSQSDLSKFVQLNQQSRSLLKMAVQKMNLSARSYFRILRVSRTIADLANSESVTHEHVAEALTYRVEIG